MQSLGTKLGPAAVDDHAPAKDTICDGRDQMRSIANSKVMDRSKKSKISRAFQIIKTKVKAF